MKSLLSVVFALGLTLPLPGQRPSTNVSSPKRPPAAVRMESYEAYTWAAAQLRAISLGRDAVMTVDVHTNEDVVFAASKPHAQRLATQAAEQVLKRCGGRALGDIRLTKLKLENRRNGSASPQAKRTPQDYIVHIVVQARLLDLNLGLAPSGTVKLKVRVRAYSEVEARLLAQTRALRRISAGKLDREVVAVKVVQVVRATVPAKAPDKRSTVEKKAQPQEVQPGSQSRPVDLGKSPETRVAASEAVTGFPVVALTTGLSTTLHTER